MSDGAFLPLPSLNLSFKKDTSINSDQTQTANATNNITITLNPSEIAIKEINKPSITNPLTNGINTNPLTNPINAIIPTNPPENTDNETSRVAIFKDRLIEIYADLLLSDKDLIKNLLETSPTKVIFHKEHLQELIGILVLPATSRENWWI
jgi:hypothetical protein